MTRLGDLLELVQEPAPDDDPLVGLQDLVPGQLRVEQVGDREPASDPARARRFRRGDLLFGALRPEQDKLALADVDGACSPEILVLRPRAPGSGAAGLALAALAHPFTRARARQLTRGTRMPRVRWRDLARVAPPLPPPADHQALGEVVALLTARLDVLHARDRADADLLRAALTAERSTAPGRVACGPRLGDVAPRRGEALPRGSSPDDVPTLGLADLPGNGLAIHAPPHSPGSGSLVPFARGDLLLPLLRPGSGKVGIAPFDGVASAEILALELDPLWRVAVAAWLLLPSTAAALAFRATGTRMPRVPREAALDLRLPLCEDGARRLSALAPLVDRALHAPDHARALHALRDTVICHGLPPRWSERVSRAVSVQEAP